MRYQIERADMGFFIDARIELGLIFIFVAVSVWYALKFIDYLILMRHLKDCKKGFHRLHRTYSCWHYATFSCACGERKVMHHKQL
jgi:hypothetical protein